MARGAFVATRGVERLGWLALAAVVFVPVLIAGLLAWALATPTDNLERVTAAIVNDDEPVTVNGQDVPLGRQFAAGLIDGTSATDVSTDSDAPTETPPPSGTGSPTSSPSADTAATTPTPSPTDTDATTDTTDFTWVLTNDDEAAAGLQSGRYVAVVTIPSTFSADATSFSGPASSARQATIEVETTPASAFLDPALTAAVTAAATAALNEQLTEQYLGNVYAAFNTISEQIGQAASGADSLSSGTSSLASGAQSLASGASQLDSGLESLDSGAESLAGGLAQLDAGVQQLPGQTAQLAEGAAQVSAGVSAISGALDEATAELAGVAAEICHVPTGPLCERVTAVLTRLQDADAQLSALADGAQQVASGNADLADAMPPLIDDVDELAAGADEVASGAAQASEGGDSLADGAQSLADGAVQVDSGAAQLASGLDEATSQIPTYSDDDITTLSTVVAQPVLSDRNAIAPGFLTTPLFTGLALWLGGLVLALARRAVPTRRLLTAASTSSIALRSALTTVGIGAAQGLVVAIIVLASVDLTSGQAVGFIGAAVFVGAVFALANQGLAAAFGGFGRLLALLIALVALIAGLSSTVPPVMASLAGAMPTAPGLSLLLAPLVGDAGTAWASAGLLALIALVSVVLVLAGVRARRRVRPATVTA